MHKLGHRPALDSLRGIAVVVVICYHVAAVFPDESPIEGAAVVGVTLFFVLSGFLITTLLVEELQRTGRLDLRAFYRRRAVRLLPALAVVIVVLAIIGLLTERGVSLVQAGWTGTYLGNFVQAGGVDLGWLVHSWSLAIEEQYYLAWPLVLMLCWQRRRVLVVGLVVLIVIMWLSRWRLQASGAPSHRLYFGLDTRGDAVIIGSVLALVAERLPRLDRLVPAAVVLLAGACVVGNSTFVYTIGLPLTALASAVVVGVAARLTDVWDPRPLAWAGRRSYGLYLWHLPIAFAIEAWLPGPLLVEALLSIALAAAMAELSFRLVEQPAQRWRAPRDAPHRESDAARTWTTTTAPI